jgi:hypothetical protein
MLTGMSIGKHVPAQKREQPTKLVLSLCQQKIVERDREKGRDGKQGLGTFS